MKILLADDEEGQLALRAMLLRQNGFDVIEASDFSASLRTAQTHKLVCAIVDLRFPTEALGFRLIRELKALDPSIYVILLTGKCADHIMECPEKRLADEIVLKSSSAPYLIQRLKALAAHPAV